MKAIQLAAVKPSPEQFDELTRGVSDSARNGNQAALEDAATFKYKAVLLSAMKAPLDVRGGMSVDEMRRSQKIIAAIKAVDDGGMLELDDGDYEFLVLKFQSARFQGYDERMIGLADLLQVATGGHAEPSPNGRVPV